MAQTRIIDGDEISVLKNGSFVKSKFIEKYGLLHNGGPCDKLYEASIIRSNNLSFCVGRMYEDLLFCTQAIYYAGGMASIDNTHYNYIIYSHSTSHSPEKAKKRYDDSLFIAEKVMNFIDEKKMSGEQRDKVAAFVKEVVMPPECLEDEIYKKKIEKILQ